MLISNWPALADEWALTEKQRQAVEFLDTYPTSVDIRPMVVVLHTFDGDRCLAITPEDYRMVQAFRREVTVR